METIKSTLIGGKWKQSKMKIVAKNCINAILYEGIILEISQDREIKKGDPYGIMPIFITGKETFTFKILRDSDWVEKRIKRLKRRLRRKTNRKKREG